MICIDLKKPAILTGVCRLFISSACMCSSLGKPVGYYSGEVLAIKMIYFCL